MRIETPRVVSSLPPAPSLQRSMPPYTFRFRLGNWLPLGVLALFTCVGALAQGKNYTSIVVFGDSLSDTGNAAQVAYQDFGICGSNPCFDYTAGRFTDGDDTLPEAHKYFGVWVEQLAAALPSHPAVTASLHGGTNYAYGDATTGNGTSTLTFVASPTQTYAVQVENIGQQITDYLATHPKIDNHTLFIVWGGAEDLLHATSAKDVTNAAVQETLNLQRLIQAGATQFLIPNLPPLGLAPAFSSSLVTSLTATAAAALYNSYLAAGISVLKDFYPFRHLAFYQLDVFNLMLRVDAAPLAYSLINVTTPAQGNALVNPDLYLFWDDLHPTTRGHNVLADAALNVLGP